MRERCAAPRAGATWPGSLRAAGAGSPSGSHRRRAAPVAGYTGAGVRVAILDGGLFDAHPGLAAGVDGGASRSFAPGACNTDVGTFRHGTHVAGIVGARDDERGVIGIAPGATLIGVKVLHAGDGGSNPDENKFDVNLPGTSTRVIGVAATAPRGWALGATDFSRQASHTNFGKAAVTVAAPGGDRRLKGSAPGTIIGLARPCRVFDPGARRDALAGRRARRAAAGRPRPGEAGLRRGPRARAGERPALGAVATAGARDGARRPRVGAPRPCACRAPR